MAVLRVDHVVRPYAWGSPTAIPDLLGLPQTGTPVAEVWLGAHSSGSARVGRGEEDQGISLRDVIARDPATTLGDPEATELPFLLKVLGVAHPLSLQVHPSPEQARLGFAREEAAGIPIDAQDRSYKDPYPKPEMLYALSSFEALIGFRRPEVIRAALAPLVSQSTLAGALLEALSGTGREGLKRALAIALAGPEAGPEAITSFVQACRRMVGQTTDDPAAYALPVTLAKRYPQDRALAVVLMMNHVSLAPGESVYLPAGVLHSYQRGLGVEVMAPSDNVLRAGFTPKHVDTEQVLEMVDFSNQVPVRPAVVREGAARVIRPPSGIFQLADIRMDGGTYESSFTGPRIALVLEGQLTAFTDYGVMHVSRGQGLFAMAAESPMSWRGQGRVMLVSPGSGLQLPHPA
ncbi:MAG: mannose-6-phosphate isomerase, class I [Bifidobacteriaceae bacterium]|jgi:mannose-6-phosphate isomerase|nr:mannose-6-phosphate isomerase, class I [Bifidobacteriaceae bacterium]